MDLGLAFAALAAGLSPPQPLFVSTEHQVPLQQLLGLDPTAIAQKITGEPGTLPAWQVDTLETGAGRLQITPSGFVFQPDDPKQTIWCDLPAQYPFRVRYMVFAEGRLAAMVPPDPRPPEATTSPAESAALISGEIDMMKRAAPSTSAVLRYFCRSEPRGAFATPEHYLGRWAQASGTALFRRLKLGEPVSAEDRRYIARGGDRWLGDLVSEKRSPDGRYDVVSIRLAPPAWDIKGGWLHDYAVGMLDGRVVWKADGTLAAAVANDLGQGEAYSLP